MKMRKLCLPIFFGLLVILQSCNRNGDDMWDDTKSAGRHIGRGIRALAGQNCHSRQVCSRDEFECMDEDACYSNGTYQEYEYQNNYSPVQGDEFIPLEDQCNDIAMNDMYTKAPKECPGDRGSTIPGIQAFRDPSTIPQLCGIFRTIYFEYDCYFVKGDVNLSSLNAIANFLRYYPNVYVFVEGHTDERGPLSYNQALGLKRCNAVRNFLIDAGVNPDQLFTISYGKERPVVIESHEEAWGRNRRVEFKIYER
ncbi:MAG: OmpA family protein [Parachlamydiaceae bacterium]|nr:OmpA family protein [Parachlamydiaceae bacterium]